MEDAIAQRGGWLPFDDFLDIALHDPQHGYYGSGRARLGGGDFHTAPTLSPLFAEVWAGLLLPYLGEGGDILELGAGAGQLSEGLLTALPPPAVRRYFILETSAALAARQQARLQKFKQVVWLSALPEKHSGAIIANEVLDCVPFRLLERKTQGWQERGVACAQDGLAFASRPLHDDAADHLRDLPLPPGYQTEVAPRAAALATALADCLQRGLLLLADYGYGRREYYHPQRSTGTLMCHRQQRSDSNPLQDIGEKDITAHVDFTAIAEAGIAGGAALAGYVTQAQGLVSGGITDRLAAYGAGSAAYLRASNAAHRLLAPHEMGEIIKWMAFTKGDAPPPAAFRRGDIRQRL